MKKLIVIMVLAILVLSACVNMDMAWMPGKVYNSLDIVLVKVGDTYQSFASLQDNNVGNYPPDTLKVWWDQ